MGSNSNPWIRSNSAKDTSRFQSCEFKNEVSLTNGANEGRRIWNYSALPIWKAPINVPVNILSILLLPYIPAPLKSKSKTPRIKPCPGSPRQDKQTPLATQTPQRITGSPTPSETLTRVSLRPALLRRRTCFAAPTNRVQGSFPQLQFDQSKYSVLKGAVTSEDGCARVIPAQVLTSLIPPCLMGLVVAGWARGPCWAGPSEKWVELASEGPGRSERFAESVDKEPPGLTRILGSLAVSFPGTGWGLQTFGAFSCTPGTHSGVRTSAGETRSAELCGSVHRLLSIRHLLRPGSDVW